MSQIKPTPRIRIPATAKAGEIVEIKTLISHEMESGHRRDSNGQLLPRKIIREFRVTFNDQEVLRTEWMPAISANPYQSFFVRVPESGTFTLTWTDDDGSVYRAEHKIAVG